MCRRETGGPYCEGLTESVRTINGFRNNDPWAAVPRPYGCWYFVAPGTGVSVNIGRSLSFDSRQHASDYFDTMSDNARWNGMGWSDDTAWCTVALERGFDSIQVNVDSAPYVHHESRTDRGMVELVVCSGRCATEELCGSCPPAEVRIAPIGNGTEASCDERSSMMNNGRVVPGPC